MKAARLHDYGHRLELDEVPTPTRPGEVVVRVEGVLENAQFEVAFETTLWGTLKELREVLALAESGTLTAIPLEFHPLEQINDVYGQVKRGEIEGRAVITPTPGP